MNKNIHMLITHRKNIQYIQKGFKCIKLQGFRQQSLYDYVQGNIFNYSLPKQQLTLNLTKQLQEMLLTNICNFHNKNQELFQDFLIYSMFYNNFLNKQHQYFNLLFLIWFFFFCINTYVKSSTSTIKLLVSKDITLQISKPVRCELQSSRCNNQYIEMAKYARTFRYISHSLWKIFTPAQKEENQTVTTFLHFKTF
eukprot:TRINITY_DN19734_c0_g1_i4.p1 TRINITY_DN19734_c0_g1~~TRINITY_DN19734_c0_g1_i4.p1  ORF type:complete len:196 (+),score=-13.79 TRINITY_DN19734_c0_g1_i4:334-921(+)